MTTRRRRTTAEVRAAILAAAGRQFGEVGYDATTFRSVASEASVAVSVVQRHYPSKDDLFDAAVLSSLLTDFRDFVQSQRDAALAPAEQVVRTLVGELQERIGRHRLGVARMLLSAAEDHATGNGGAALAATDGLAHVLDDLRRMSRAEATRRGWPSPDDGERSSFLLTAAALGMVLMRPLLPADHWAADEDAAADALARLGMYGLALRPDTSGEPGGPRPAREHEPPR